jgi:hypothetical protein
MKKETLQIKVWKHLKAKGPKTARELRAHFVGRSDDSIYQVIQYLSNRGSVVSDGSTWLRKHHATDVYPTDNRGRMPEASVNLAMGRESNRQFARYRTGVLPKPATALEEFWR